VTPKSSNVWNCFSHIYVNDVKQEHVICNKCRDLLIYKHSSGTHSLSKHIRHCQNTATKVSESDVQVNINQYYESSKNKSCIPNRVKQEIKVACAEFVTLDCRSFNTISGNGFKNLAQKLFNAGRYLPISREISIESLHPNPTTISRYIDQKASKLMLIRSFRLCQVVLIMEITGGFGFNPVLSPAVCILFKYFSKPEYGIHQMNQKVYTIVVDFWKDTFTGIHYCGISLHHISNDWKLQCFVIGCYPYDLES
ncbi:unnamed protein product, partial [Rotaria magnacalcarata]